MKNKELRMADWEQLDMLSLIRSWARNGYSVEGIAKKMCVAKGTLYNWIGRSSKIAEAINSGGAIATALIEDKLVEKAKEGEGWAVMFYLRHNRASIYNPKLSISCEPDIEDEDASLQIEVSNAKGDEQK